MRPAIFASRTPPFPRRAGESSSSGSAPARRVGRTRRSSVSGITTSRYHASSGTRLRARSRARGATTVMLVDVNQARLDLAARAEPDATIDSTKDDPIDAVRKMTNGRGADVVITATGVGQAQEQALEMTTPRGRISLFGGLPKDDSTIRFDSNLVHYRELSVFGAYGSAPRHNREAPALIADGKVRAA